MKDKDLYAQILGLSAPWEVASVEVDSDQGEIRVYVGLRPGETIQCPDCSAPSPRYDKRRRRWRHLDTCQFKTILVADVPRVECREHGVHTIPVPWAAPGSGFTALFESLIIDWLGEASISAVARRLRISWNAIDGVKQRAVERGLARRAATECTRIGVDETAFKKRHDYITVVSDQDNGTVLHVGDGRTSAALEAWYKEQTEERLAKITSIAMDMWPAYIRATRAYIPDAKTKIAFDKFHVAHMLGDAVDRVRRLEHKQLLAQDRKDLKNSRFWWLYQPENVPDKYKAAFNALRNTALLTAQAWTMKTVGMSLWKYVSRTWARKAWKNWIQWAGSSELPPMQRVAKTIDNHLWGILNAVVMKVTNGPAEGINSRIKAIKVRCRGFRNKQRFANDVYFHLGGLSLYPKELNP